MGDPHDVRACLGELAGRLYDNIHQTGTIDLQRIQRDVTALLAEGGYTNQIERTWLRYTYAWVLRRTQSISLDLAIDRLNKLLGAPPQARMHGLMVAIYAELVLLNHEVGNTFLASMMAINLRLEACNNEYCQGHLTALGLCDSQITAYELETAAA